MRDCTSQIQTRSGPASWAMIPSESILMGDLLCFTGGDRNDEGLPVTPCPAGEQLVMTTSFC